MSTWPDRRYLPEYLRKRFPAGAAVYGVGMGGTRHRRGSVTDAQQELHDYVMDNHGGHSTYVATDGSMHLTRPGKDAANGSSASVITGEQGDAILTVFSSNWAGIGPLDGEASRSWRLVDGALVPAYLDPLGGVTINVPPSTNGTAPPVVERVALVPMPLITFKALPRPFVIRPIVWHAENLLCRDTHGELAGAEKSLKSYTGLALDVGMATGLPVLGRFEVPERQRVLVLVGEGGEGPFLRRVAEVCSGYGISPGDLDDWLRYSTDHASASSLRFLDGIRHELDTFGPALVHVDPWYTYQPSATESSQLTSVGATLDAVGEVCRAGGATALINHHFNRQGNTGLRQITGAGHSEWVDSWVLTEHRSPPNVEGGRYSIRLDVGSRQWGGGAYDVDYTITPLMGRMSWKVSEASEVDDGDSEDRRFAEVKLALLRTGRKARKALTRAAWVERTKGRASTLRAAFDELVDDGLIVVVATVQSGPNTVSSYELGDP